MVEGWPGWARRGYGYGVPPVGLEERAVSSRRPPHPPPSPCAVCRRHALPASPTGTDRADEPEVKRRRSLAGRYSDRARYRWIAAKGGRYRPERNGDRETETARSNVGSAAVAAGVAAAAEGGEGVVVLGVLVHRPRLVPTTDASPVLRETRSRSRHVPARSSLRFRGVPSVGPSADVIGASSRTR